MQMICMLPVVWWLKNLTQDRDIQLHLSQFPRMEREKRFFFLSDSPIVKNIQLTVILPFFFIFDHKWLKPALIDVLGTSGQ